MIMSGRVKIPSKRAALQRVAGHVASNLQASGTDEILGDPGAEELLTPAEAARLDWGRRSGCAQAVPDGRTVMTIRYTTPRQLEETLIVRLRRAGYERATPTNATRYVHESGEPCLKASVHKYTSVSMDPETRAGHEAVLAEM